MKRIPFDRFSDKRFYYANAPPCKQGFSLTTDFTWRIILCTKKFLIRFDLLRINGISRIPRFMHTVPYNHYHSGIRFFYKKILKKNWDDDDIPRMKRDRKLPTVLTKTEISAILDATPNLKHKAMIATMYSGGLRVSEVTHLHYDDISRTNKTIHIRDGKSRSDRYTLLADRTLEILTEYWFQCGRPRGILFPSSWTGDYLTKDSVIQFFRESAKRAGIQKHVSTHCLRHSFASHLFESGCDVKYIQALLGHRDPKSTEVYLHVSNKTLLGIRSPFDEMGGE